jgi:hypothetical protein
VHPIKSLIFTSVAKLAQDERAYSEDEPPDVHASVTEFVTFRISVALSAEATRRRIVDQVAISEFHVVAFEFLCLQEWTIVNDGHLASLRAYNLQVKSFPALLIKRFRFSRTYIDYVLAMN